MDLLPWRGQWLQENSATQTQFPVHGWSQKSKNAFYCLALQMKGRWESNINVPFMHAQKWNCAVSLFPKQNYNVLSPNSYTHITVRNLYCIFLGSVCLFCCSQICGPILGINRSQTRECRNWDWGCGIPFPVIHKLDFRYSVYLWQYLVIGFDLL